jgi:PEP-CTERM motif
MPLVIISRPTSWAPPLATTGNTGVVGAVPEPETYAMLLAGLAVMGFVVRRRRQSQDDAAA